MKCKYWDCGWCYAPVDLPTKSVQGACDNVEECETHLKEVENDARGEA